MPRIRRTSAAGLLVAAALTFCSGESYATPQTISYTYDATGRLTSVTYDGAVRIDYGYDASGNLVSMETGTVTGVDPPGDTVHRFRLDPCWPNPLRTATRITFELEAPGEVHLDVFDVQGRRVRTVIAERRPAGPGEASWDGHNDGGRPVPAGSYFYRIRSGIRTATGKVVVTR